MVHSSRSSNRKTQKKCTNENRTQDLSVAYTDLPGILISLFQTFRVAIMTVFQHKRGVAHRTNLDKLHSRKCSLSKFSCYVLQFASKHPNKGILCEFVPAKKQQVRRIGYQNWMTYTCHVRYLSAKTHNIEQLVRVTPSKKPHNWCCLVPIVWVFTPF